MPTYVCTVSGTELDDGKKMRIAREITRLHTQYTSAPHFFAQVFFTKPARGDHFIAGSPAETESIFVRGDIRGGRTKAVKRKLVAAIVDAVHRLSGIPLSGVWVYLNDMPPSQMAEFGHILPEPGTEKEWLDALPAAERERMRNLGDASASAAPRSGSAR